MRPFSVPPEASLKIPNESVIPPGGFHFVEKFNGVDIRIDGHSYASVAENVLRHRLQNGRPPGDPLLEVYASVCNAYPHFCRDTDPRPAVAVQRGPEPISRRVAAWMGRFLSLGADAGVTQKEANIRANTCLNCPSNVDHKAGGCPACAQSVDRGSFVYRRNRTTVDDAKLGTCDVLSEHLPTSIWSGILVPSEDPKLPEYCWRKKR